MITNIINSLQEAKLGLEDLLNNNETLVAIEQAAKAIIKTFELGGTVFSCGNGGSMCDAMHFAEELTGKYRHPRRGFPAMAISDSGHLTCVGNDYGYEQVFARFLASHANSGDVLLAISTSGSSKNILEAVLYAKSKQIMVIALTGKKNSVVGREADITICTPAGHWADRVQELHIKILHILIELIERHFCPMNYEST